MNNHNKKILLCGVFGPFAQDDEYGSRKDNPMELYHNQVTRIQGPFSLRMFHRTFSLLMIEANIHAACTVLDFPTLTRFIDEIKNNSYDIVGISAITVNIGKVKKMCEEIRKHLSQAEIVVGGHIANFDDLNNIIDADYICKGDGIRWFREYLGQDVNAPIKHPDIISGFGTRILGIKLIGKNTTGILIPSVGCPMGCNFCSTSALFGGKGKSLVFYNTGDELFNVLSQLEKKRGFNSFFVLDENFLLYKQRSLRLLELMKEHNKSWAFYVFSSARVLQSYSIEELVGLGISWVWVGIEGDNSNYSKLNGVDTRQLIKKLQSNGICVLGSTIIGLEDHTPENINNVIDYAVSHDTDFHQFMLYTPIHGTPLYYEHLKKNNLLTEEECPTAEIHGQRRFNFKHPHIKNGQELNYLLKSFTKDFEVNGPSLARITRTSLKGWKKHKNNPDKRIVKRFKLETFGLSSIYSAAIWAMTRYYRTNKYMLNRMNKLLEDLYTEFGLKTRILTPILGTFIIHNVYKEEKKLSLGWTYEPSVVYEKNALALKLEKNNPVLSNIKVPQINHPVYDLKHVIISCREHLEISQKNIMKKFEHAQEQLHSIYDQYFNKSLQLSPVKIDQSANIPIHTNENVLINISQIRESMEDMIITAKDNITTLRNFMSEKYKNAQKEIRQNSNEIYKNIKFTINKTIKKCKQLEKTIYSNK